MGDFLDTRDCRTMCVQRVSQVVGRTIKPDQTRTHSVFDQTSGKPCQLESITSQRKVNSDVFALLEASSDSGQQYLLE
jgi:hypothetical protein